MKKFRAIISYLFSDECSAETKSLVFSHAFAILVSVFALIVSVIGLIYSLRR